MNIQKYLAGALACTSLFAISVPVLADSGVATADSTLPAVSDTNGAVSVYGGVVGSNKGLAGVGGDLAFPLSHSWGFQVDGALAVAKDQLHGGTSGQIFWRNPNVGLLGAYGSYSFIRDENGSYFGSDRTFSVGRAAINAARYTGRFTVEAITGVETGSLRTRFFDNVDVAYYPVDNFKLSAGHRYTDNVNYGNLSAEYLLSSASRTPFSLFVDASYAGDHHKAILAGVKIHFGATGKTLIRRDREDDPTTLLGLDQSVLTTCQNVGIQPNVVPQFYPATGSCAAPVG